MSVQLGSSLLRKLSLDRHPQLELIADDTWSPQQITSEKLLASIGLMESDNIAATATEGYSQFITDNCHVKFPLVRPE